MGRRFEVKKWAERILGAGMIALDTVVAAAVLPGAFAAVAVLAVAVGLMAWPLIEVIA